MPAAAVLPHPTAAAGAWLVVGKELMCQRGPAHPGCRFP